MKKIYSVTVYLIGITTLLVGCQGYEKKLKVEEVDYSPTSQENDIGIMAIFQSRGESWKTWDLAWKNCFQSDIFRKAKFLGLTNTINLGSISAKNFSQTQRRLEDAFSPDEIKSLIDTGSIAPCNQISMVETSFNGLIGGELNFNDTSGLTAELKVELAKKRNLNFKIPSWQKQELMVGKLKDMLQSTDPKIVNYRANLFDSKNVLMTKAAKVNSFECELKFSRAMSLGLQAKLDSGAVGKIEGAGAEFSFRKIDSLTVSVKSNNPFYVFGVYVRQKE